MVVTVVNVGLIAVSETLLESFPGSFGSELGSDVFATFGFVENSCLALDSEVLAKSLEPFEDR